VKAILRRGFMARKFAGILLAMLVGVALSGITACDQSGPADKPAMEKSMEGMEKMGEAAEGAAEEAAEAQQEETQ
jgi:hypothetical protein